MRYSLAIKQNIIFRYFRLISCHGISFLSSFRLKCKIKQLFDSVFAICKIINVSVRVICLAFSSADNLYLDIDNSAYH